MPKQRKSNKAGFNSKVAQRRYWLTPKGFLATNPRPTPSARAVDEALASLESDESDNPYE